VNLRAAATLIVAALLMASLTTAAASQAESSPAAEPAKAKTKKKKKRKKRKSVPVAPDTATGTVAPGPEAPPEDPPDPPDPFPTCAGDDAAEPDNSTGSATLLPYETRSELTRFKCPDNPDFFQVTVAADGFYAVDVIPSAWDAVLIPYNENGSQMSAVDNHGHGVGEYMTFDNIGNPSPVVRYIEVAGKSISDSGGYTFNGYET
jgi:hypothetical protein